MTDHMINIALNFPAWVKVFFSSQLKALRGCCALGCKANVHDHLGVVMKKIGDRHPYIAWIEALMAFFYLCLALALDDLALGKAQGAVTTHRALPAFFLDICALLQMSYHRHLGLETTLADAHQRYLLVALVVVVIMIKAAQMASWID